MLFAETNEQKFSFRGVQCMWRCGVLIVTPLAAACPFVCVSVCLSASISPKLLHVQSRVDSVEDMQQNLTPRLILKLTS